MSMEDFTFSGRSQGSCSSRAGSLHGPIRRPAGSPRAGFPCPCSPCRGPRDCTCSESGSHSAASRTDRSFELQKICLALLLLLLLKDLVRTQPIIQRCHLIVGCFYHLGRLIQLRCGLSASLDSCAPQGLFYCSQAGQRIPIGVVQRRGQLPASSAFPELCWYVAHSATSTKQYSWPSWASPHQSDASLSHQNCWASGL